METQVRVLTEESSERLHFADGSTPELACAAPSALGTCAEERHDEWGLYNPDRCGVGAVIARIGGTASPDDPADQEHGLAMLLRLGLDDE